jgi:hypothetical protein
MITNYKLGQFKLEYEEYQKLKVMFQFINPYFSFINININAIRSHAMKAHFALNTRAEPQRCVLWLPDCSKIQYTQFLFNTHISYSIHTFYIQYTLRIFNKPVLYSIFTEIYSISSQKHSITLLNIQYNI